MAAVAASGERSIPRLLLRYVTGQVASAVVFGLGGIAVFVGTADLIGNLGSELRDGIPFPIVVRIQLLKLPEMTVQVAWVAMLAALLLVLGQMARRREYMAMLASGISIYQIGVPVLFVAGILSLGVFGVQEVLIPTARDAAATLRGIYADDPAADLRGEIMDVTYLSGDNRSYVIKRVDLDRGLAWDIRMDRVEDNRITESLTAAEGVWLPGRRRWQWSGVIARTFTKTQHIEREDHLETLVSRLRASPSDLRVEKRLMLHKYDLAYLSIAQLRRRIKALARSNQAPNPLYTVYYSKWSEPFSAVVIALLAIPGALSVERRGLARGVVATVTASVAFFVLRQVGFALGRGGIVAPVIGAWGPLLVTAAFGIAWLRRTPT